MFMKTPHEALKGNADNWHLTLCEECLCGTEYGLMGEWPSIVVNSQRLNSLFLGAVFPLVLIPTVPRVLLCSLPSMGRGGALQSDAPPTLLLLWSRSWARSRLWMEWASNQAPGDWGSAAQEELLLSCGGVRLPHRAGWMSLSRSITLHLQTGQGSVRVPQ